VSSVVRELCFAHTEVEYAALVWVTVVTRSGDCNGPLFLVTFNPVTRQFSLFGYDCDVVGLASLILFGV